MTTSVLPRDAMDSTLARRLILWPVASSLIATWAFGSFVRPAMSGQPWLLDSVTVVIGAAAILAGGALAFAIPQHRTRSAAPRRLQWMFAATAGLLAAAVSGVPAAGVPWMSASVFAVAMCGAWVWMRGRSNQPR